MKSINKRSIALLMLVFTVSLHAQQQEKKLKNQETMTAVQTLEKNKEVIQKLYRDCLNTGNFDLLNELISKDYKTNYKGKDVYGPAGYAETVKTVLQGIPDVQFTIKNLIAEGDMVTVQWQFEGTHKGTFFGFPASGKKVINNAVAIFRLRNNKIIENWVYPDRLAILQQIGAIPPLQAPVPDKSN